MNESKIDVAVLFIFFARPEQTAKVFEQIRIARPSKLFLYQDGAREKREDDVAGVEACRKIVEYIDWDCEVHRWYQDHNVGCDPSEYLSQKWMFDHVDRGIILEDDDVPSQSFFPFCKELLDKYADDERIGMISGMNHMDTVDLDEDYFFSSNRGPIWGWASWRRVIDLWDPEYHWLQDNKLVSELLLSGVLTPKRIKIAEQNKKSGIAHYEDFSSITRILHRQLAIIPSKNLISNIGLTENATHCKIKLEEMPPKMRKIYNKQTFEYEFPLKHPKYVFDNVRLSNEIMSTMTENLGEKIFNIKIKFKKLFSKICGMQY